MSSVAPRPLSAFAINLIMSSSSVAPLVPAPQTPQKPLPSSVSFPPPSSSKPSTMHAYSAPPCLPSTPTSAPAPAPAPVDFDHPHSIWADVQDPFYEEQDDHMATPQGGMARSAPMPIPGGGRREEEDLPIPLSIGGPAAMYRWDGMGNQCIRGLWVAPDGCVVPGKPECVRWEERKRRRQLGV